MLTRSKIDIDKNNRSQPRSRRRVRVSQLKRWMKGERFIGIEPSSGKVRQDLYEFSAQSAVDERLSGVVDRGVNGISSQLVCDELEVKESSEHLDIQRSRLGDVEKEYGVADLRVEADDVDFGLRLDNE